MMSGRKSKALVIQRLLMMIFDCNTILCVQNQMPDLGMDDLFIIGYLVVGLAIIIYLVMDTLKEH